MRRMVQDGRIYTELEVKGPELILLLRSEIGSNYPGVDMTGATVRMQPPFPAIVWNPAVTSSLD